MEATLRIADVAVSETRNANKRYVLRAEDGAQCTTTSRSPSPVRRSPAGDDDA
jgi:hypothetical protein